MRIRLHTWPVFQRNDFSRSQSVTYTVQVTVSRKLCKITTLLLYRPLIGSDDMETFLMSLSDLQAHAPIADVLSAIFRIAADKMSTDIARRAVSLWHQSFSDFLIWTQLENNSLNNGFVRTTQRVTAVLKVYWRYSDTRYYLFYSVEESAKHKTATCESVERVSEVWDESWRRPAMMRMPSQVKSSRSQSWLPARLLAVSALQCSSSQVCHFT